LWCWLLAGDFRLFGDTKTRRRDAGATKTTNQIGIARLEVKRFGALGALPYKDFGVAIQAPKTVLIIRKTQFEPEPFAKSEFPYVSDSRLVNVPLILS
jgi:hypothetical protein